MVAHGRVQNGVVVFSAGTSWPEGQEVTVLANDHGVQPSSNLNSSTHSIMDIPVLSLGRLLQPLENSQADLLSEMLEGRT